MSRTVEIAALLIAAALPLAPSSARTTGNIAGTEDDTSPRTTLMRRCIEGKQPFAQFGVALSSAGDVNGDGYEDAIIVANGHDASARDEGRVFVYYGSPWGIGSRADWTADGDRAGVMLGCAVSAAGDINGDGYDDILVGTPHFKGSAGTVGVAYAYFGSESGLGKNPDWVRTGDQGGAKFGATVFGAGDVNGDGFADVVVGAPYQDGAVGDEGRAFVYYGSKDGPSGEPDWTAWGDQPGAYFGCSVSTAGDVNADGYDDIVVGARGRGQFTSRSGGAFVYMGSASGLRPSPMWLAEEKGPGTDFGGTVGAAGDVNGDGFDDVVVGARLHTSDEDSEGRVYVYHGSTAGVGDLPAWRGEGNQVRAEYGRAVASAGDVNGDGYDDLIVGALDYDADHVDEGRAFVYCGTSTGLGLTPTWVMDGGQPEAYFGSAVAGTGDVNGDGFDDVLMGAYLYDHDQRNEGRACLLFGGPTGPGSRLYWRGEGDQVDALFGVAVASAGDVNGDGYGDVVIGAPFHDEGDVDEGRAVVYEGSASGLKAMPDWEKGADQPSAGFGRSVASAGDVNGDGFDDVIVGAPLYDHGETDEGRAFVYLGSPSGLALAVAWTGEADRPNSWYGTAVTCAGDVNGDGFDDIVIGAPARDGTKSGRGSVFVHYGSASGPNATANWSAHGECENAGFGGSVASAGDVNNDGYDDVIIGAPGHCRDRRDEGRAVVYLGSSSGLGLSPAWTADGDQAAGRFGACVSGGGDINGDGYDDVIVGASNYDKGKVDEGAAFLFLGSPSGLCREPGWTGEGDRIYAFFGYSSAAAGDVDRDGFHDVIIGAHGFDHNGRPDAGRVLVYRGSRSGLVPVPAWSAIGGQQGAQFGYPVAGAGDVNGDGFDDLIVGSERYANGEILEGAAFVFYSGPAGKEASAP